MNNAELVVVDKPKIGKWTIDVHATAVYTSFRQGYAVVASGSLVEPWFAVLF